MKLLLGFNGPAYAPSARRLLSLVLLGAASSLTACGDGSVEAPTCPPPSDSDDTGTPTDTGAPTDTGPADTADTEDSAGEDAGGGAQYRGLSAGEDSPQWRGSAGPQYRSLGADDEPGLDDLPPPPMPTRQAAFRGEHWE